MSNLIIKIQLFFYRKVKSFKQTVFLSEQCQVLTVRASVRSAVFRRWHRPTIVLPVRASVRSAVFRRWHRPAIVLPLVYCLLYNRLFEVSPDFAVRACQVATVVMETTQLVLRQFKNFLQQTIEHGLSLSIIISKRCELVKLCHTNRSGPVFLRHTLHIFRFARILNEFRYNSQEIITTAYRVNDYILGEIGTGTREQDTREYSNRWQSVLWRCEKSSEP